MAHPEHVLQQAAVRLAKIIIIGPHVFRCFDRTKDFSGTQHLWEAARGVRSGTPDSELVFEARSINVEFKAPGTRHLKSHQPTENQEREMAALRAAEAYAGCAWSLAELVEHWRAAGVALIPSADVVAMTMDAEVLAKIAGTVVTKKAPRKARGRVTAAQVRRAEAFRG